MMTAEISLQRTLGNVEDEIDENDDAGRCKSSQIFHKKTKNDDDDDDDDDGWRRKDISAAVHTDSRIQLHSHCLTLIYTDEESSIPFLLQDEARLPIQTYM